MNINSMAWRSIFRLQQIYPKEVGEICNRIGLSESILSNQNLVLPINMFLNFFIEAESVFNDDLITINYARLAQIRPNYAEALGLMFVYSRHLKEGFKLLQAYINIELEGINVLIKEEQSAIKIQFIADQKVKHPSIYENLCLSMLAVFIRSKRFQIKYINTKINAIDVSLKEKSIFNCPINLKSTETSITVSQNNYLKKSSISNPKLVSYLSSIAIKSLEEKAVNRTLTEKIEILMSNYENHYNNISIQEISNQLGISVNTLRNHLSRDKTTFRQVFNNYKLMKSKNMLKEGFSVKVVSYKLGYSDPSSFIRWFIDQTQLTPTSYKIGLKT